MEKYFRTQEGELVNVVDHTLEQLELWPDLKIYVGTDSQTEHGMLSYATCIVYRYGTRGAHYIMHVEQEKAIKDDFLRLYKEGIRTLEAAAFLTDNIPVEVQLEFDYAGVANTISSPLVGVFSGYLNTRFKGAFMEHEMIATKAADHVARHFKTIKAKWPGEDKGKSKLRVA